MSLVRLCFGHELPSRMEKKSKRAGEGVRAYREPTVRVVERPLALPNDMEEFLTAMKSVEDFETLARLRLPDNTWQYVMGRPERGNTYTANLDAFTRVKLQPRLLQDVSPPSGGRLRTSLLGSPVELPIGVSPTSCHQWYWKDGEISTARGTSLASSCYIMSCNANTKMVDLAATSGGLRWMQTYIFKDRSAVERLVRMAEKNGFKAIVVTVDVSGFPYAASPTKPAPGMWSGTKMEVLHEIGATKTPGNPVAEDATWRDMDYIRGLTKLPLVVKGVLTAEGARSAVLHGADAVLVSNHGGRQLDTDTATFDALAEVVAAVGDRVEVYLDGGVRHGTDVLKALALGARAVFLGRPAIWGLACGGAAGVHRVLSILKAELEHSMCMAGCRTLEDVDAGILCRKST